MFLAFAVGVLAYSFLMDSNEPISSAESANTSERRALREKSLSAVDAANLELQGRGLLFPLLDSRRQKLATSLFREVIDLAPAYFGGYAGSAHSLGTLALLTPTGSQKSEYQNEALKMARRAVDLAPQEGWSQSALAWARLSKRDFDEAFRLSELAIELDPNNDNVLNSYGMIMIVTGHFEKARDTSSPNRSRQISGTASARRNIFGVASFHLSDFEEAARSFEAAAELGDPVGAPSLVFLAASFEGAGLKTKAKRLVSELQQTYPSFDPQVAFSGFYQDEKHVNTIINALRRVGWELEK